MIYKHTQVNGRDGVRKTGNWKRRREEMVALENAGLQAGLLQQYTFMRNVSMAAFKVSRRSKGIAL